MQGNDIYDKQFRGSVVIAGKTRCRKTYFMQKLVINNFLGGHGIGYNGYHLLN